MLLDSEIEIINNEIINIIFKTDMIIREKRFMEICLNDKVSLDKANQKAGYQPKVRQNSTLIGKRILEKYCQSVQDHKNIFRQISFSESC